MKVLLISPKDPKVPTNLKFLMGGENTYTTTLLAHPPDGVEYTHHTDAIRTGKIKLTGFGKIDSLLMKMEVLPPDAGVISIKLKDNFDLIHCHAYNLKSEGSHPPVVLGDSSCNLLYLRDYIGWSEARIGWSYRFRKASHQIMGIYDQVLNLADARILIVFSEFAKRVHMELGMPEEKICVVYPGLVDRPAVKKDGDLRVNILFAGVWFERKGGMVILEAFRKLAPKYKNLKLTLLGPLPGGVTISKNENIEQKDFVLYDRLLDYYRRADIFVLVPLKAEGYGLVVEEAMSFGLPVVVSNIYALPEMVKDGETGLVAKPGDTNDLVEKLEILIKNPTLRKNTGEAARVRFMEKFWIKKTNEKLLKVYREACGRRLL